MSVASAAILDDADFPEDQLQNFSSRFLSGVMNEPVRAVLSAARAQVEEGLDFSALYLKATSTNRIPYALQPLLLTEDEVIQLEEIRKRPSRIDKSRIKGIPSI